MLSLATGCLGRGTRQAMRPTLRKERTPKNQNTVDKLEETSSNPTIEVDVVLETC